LIVPVAPEIADGHRPHPQHMPGEYRECDLSPAEQQGDGECRQFDQSQRAKVMPGCFDDRGLEAI
jgi:hypothetical protein